MFNKKAVLITGGLGFVGSTLAINMIKNNAKVTLIDSLIPEYGGNLFNISENKNKIKINISDVRDEHSMKYLIQGQDYLFNLAGQTSHIDSMQDPITDLEINAKSQLFILEACRKYNKNIRIVFASTRQVYGKPEHLPVDEKHPLNPVDINGVNKLAGEWYHLLYNDIYGIHTSILRLTNTIGPRMRIKDARQTFLGIWIRLLLEGKPFEVWGGEQLRDINYVDDVVDALLMVATNEKAKGQVFNLGDKKPFTLKQIADLLIEINKQGEYKIKSYPEDRKRIDIGDYYSDFGKINSILGWKPKTSLHEALTKTLNYYRKNLKYYI